MNLKTMIRNKKIPRNQLIRRVGPGLLLFLYVGTGIFFPDERTTIITFLLGITFLIGTFFSIKSLFAKKDTSSDIPFFVEKPFMLISAILCGLIGGWIIYMLAVTTIFK